MPEDRMAQGLVPDFEIWRNITLPALERRISSSIRFLSLSASANAVGKPSACFRSRRDSPEILVKELSGGNAQKVTIAKWLFSDVKLFLLDEPTAGIDIGAKTEILRLIRQLASEGKSVIIVSSEFEELLAVS